MNPESKLYDFIDRVVPYEIKECIDGVFEHSTHPDISFKLLRECITNLKKKHVKLYNEYLQYMETDAEYVPTEFEKFKLSPYYKAPE